MSIFDNDILYWPHIAHIGFIECDSKSKQVYIKEWQKLDLDNVDYESNLKAGLYKNGIAIRLGKCLTNGSGKQLYSFALDFDGWDAVKEWFGTWEKVLEVAKKTRIEWHQDQNRIHMFFLAPRPVTNRKIHMGNSLLEIRCENNLLFAAPSIHESGVAYSPLGTSEIRVLDQQSLLKLEAKIDFISSNYMSDENKEAYEQWLDDPNTILGVGEGRHDALKFKINSYYFKYSGEWLDLTDEQRFVKAWEWNLAHCDPPKPKEEFNALVEWTIRTHKENRDAIHNRERELRKVTDKKTQAEMVLEIADQICQEFFHDQYNMPYVAVKSADHIEALPIASKRFKNFLCGQYYEKYTAIPNSDSIANASNILNYKADVKGSMKHLELRVADDGGDILYDMTNAGWDIVRISKTGWNVEKSPVIFRRYSNQLAQVMPSKNYDKDIFDKFLGLLNVKDNDNKLLLKCYIIALFVPGISKAILMLHGDQGSAKTTLQELIKMLVDPSSVKTLAFPRDINEFVQKLAHNYIGYFDNVSVIQDWISDILCRAATGSGFSKRMLFSDDDDIIYNFIRCVGFNGINLAATKADLLDRGLIVQLMRITKDKRRQSKYVWADFEKLRPQLLGYIFDILVKVLAIIGTFELEELARMADFAKVCETISRAMGNKNGAFITAYDKNIELQAQQVLESNIIAQVIVEFMKDKQNWSGSASGLLGEISSIAETLKINTKDKAWPKAPNTLVRRLNEIKATLEEFGINVNRGLDSKSKIKTIELGKTKLKDISQFGNDTW